MVSSELTERAGGQVGVDMSRFRAFPYRGSLLRRTDGHVQEVFHEPISAKVPSRQQPCVTLGHT